MKNKIIQFSAQIDGINVKKDKTLSIKLGTQELSPDDSSKIIALLGYQIWIAMAETTITSKDLNIPEALTEFVTDKSQSQRLRNVLWVYWNKNLKGKVEWEVWYKKKTDNIIEFIKEKLDE